MFYVHEAGICCVPAIFERRRGRLGSKISTYGQLVEVVVYFAMPGLPPQADINRKGRHVRWVPDSAGGTAGKSSEAPIRKDGHRKLGVLARSAVFRRIFASNLVDLVLCELPWRHAGRIAGFPEKTVQTRRRDNPEQQQFVIGICEPVPSVLGNEYRPTLLEGMTYVVQYECSTSV